MGLSGQRLLGIPISVQPTQAEKNRLANAPPVAAPKNPIGPMRLYVGSLHFNITEDMLRGIFEPYGQIDNIQLIMDTETGRSKGYGFITVSRIGALPTTLASLIDTLLSLCSVPQCGRCEEGAGAIERLRIGHASHEGGQRDGASGHEHERR